MTCTPGIVFLTGGDFVFPRHATHTAWTPVDIPIVGCGLGDGLAMLNPGGGSLTVGVRRRGHPDENFHWIDSGWWVAEETTLHYAGRTDTHILGVTRYPDGGKIDDGVGFDSGYYNPNAYWVPPPTDPTAPPPPGADPDATTTTDPTTTNPPVYTVIQTKPYHYATMKFYAQKGTNRTGVDLAEDPDHPGTFDDPFVAGTHALTFLYDDQAPDDSNLANAEWTPTGEDTQNQRVAVMAATTPGGRGIRSIARNRHSWKEVGVYSMWDSIGGSNVTAATAANVEGHAKAYVEAYGRAPNYLTLELPLEPADGWPAYGDPGHRPMPFRDFEHGDRVKVRVRKGYMDTGVIVVRITQMTLGQPDEEGNVSVALEVAEHMTDLSEITADTIGPGA